MLTERSVEENPLMENDKDKQRAISLKQHCEDLYSKGDVQTALDASTQFLKADPELVVTHNNIAVLCWERGDSCRAIEHFLAALNTNPNNRDVVVNLAKAYNILGKLDQARQLYSSYLHNNPGDMEISSSIEDLNRGVNITLPFSPGDWEKTPLAVRTFLKESVFSEMQLEAVRKKRLMHKLKTRHFPNSAFVGPYEQAGIVHGMISEQWLWQYRHLVRGEVLDMSTPVYWNAFLRELATVTKWLISDLSEKEVSKLGHSSKVDIIGDFCASPPLLPPESLDTILCISILEHCKDPMAMGRNLSEILRPGGIVFFYTPYAYIDGHLTPDYWRLGHDGYLLLAEQAGLSVIATGEYVDMGKYFLLEFGESFEATTWHRGVPFNNWMICKRPK